MKKMMILFLIINSIFFSGFISPKREIYKELKKADKLYSEKKFDEALEIYKSLLNKNQFTEEIKDRIGLVNYQKGDYKNINLEDKTATAGKLFNKGNVLKKLGDDEQTPDKKMESYKKALQNYKSAMKLSNDLNIRKNYEIVNKLLKIAQNNKKQQNKNDKNKQNQNKNNKNKNDKEAQNNKNSDSKDQNSNSSDEKQKKQDQKEQNKKEQKKDTEQSKQDQKSDEKNAGSGEKSKEKIDQNKLDEILYHLKKLEMNEKEDLKNNQRVLRGQNDEDGKNW